ncbi:hypothetical protein OB920_07375 [Halobacteria archaeon HArc-gm2]|nr:hypothetical protein [Halobacteria archaeon HArc-gm2]
MMASRNQSAIGPDEKLLLLILGVLVAGMILLGMVFGVANGIASGISGFLLEAGLPAEMSRDLGKVVHWVVVGLLFMGLVKVASQIFG